MRPSQAGLRGLVITAAAAVVVVSGVVLLEALHYGSAAAGIEPAAAARLRNVVIGTLLGLGVIIAAASMVAAHALHRALTRLRSAMLTRARGDTQTPLPSFGVRELADVASAIERVSVRDAAREAEARRESEEVATLLDAVSEGIVRLDSTGRVQRANPAALVLLGLPAAAVGQPISALIRQADLRQLLERAAAGAPVHAAEVTVGERRLMMSARPLGGGGAGRDGAVVAFVDLTEVRRLESVRRDFVANVSHELKTPLTSIRGYLETLLSDDELPADTRRQFLEVVHKNAGRLHRIIDDLLDLSRLESGGWRPELGPVDVVPVIEDVWSGCSALADRRRIHFVGPRASARALADPAGLRQVLANLIDNAIRYTPEGGTIAVSVSTEVVGSSAQLRVQVRDNGAGIPSEALPRIFERFYRADPARSRAEGGTGLGLSIVRHLLERMGGDVSAESELGRGTVITFRLPAAHE